MDDDYFMHPNRMPPGYHSRGPQLSQGGLSQSERPSSSQEPQLTSSNVSLLLDLAEQLREGQRGVKRPADQKSIDKKPKQQKEEFKCQFKNCKSVLASKVNLFRHMRNVHGVTEPERLFGCSIDNSIVNLDESLMEYKCIHCDFVTNNINAIDAHSATVHGILPTVSCKVCNFKTSNSQELAAHSRGHIASTSTGFESLKDKMHKCDDCECYFEEKKKFDEHMKKLHGFEAECKICNKNFLFKDFDFHVKSCHPDVYGKKNEVEATEKIVKVTLKLKSGNVKHVFKCKTCNARFDDENKAQRHTRDHNKDLKTREVIKKRVVKNISQKDLPPENNVLFICETCDIACESYDAAVQHSQNHITKPNATFVTETCVTCKFKFESVCYEKHLDRHYRDKELNRESFKTINYKFNLLLSKDWIDSFNSDLNIKEIEEQSIYASARSVKMRVISETVMSSKIFNLYQCGKCDTFVEPTTVTNHTLNYDTCMKIKHSVACKVCNRKFNTSFLLDKHQKVHNGDESFRIIVFNSERDKEFNDILNDPKIGLKLQNLENHAETNSNQNEVNNIDRNDAVVYKCMCGLCFVSKRKAEDHTQLCPGNDTKQNCPKCNSLFNISELVSHLEQHLNGATRFRIEDFIPEPIVIDSDDDLESSNSTKDTEKNKGIKVIKAEHSFETNRDIPVFEVLDSDEEIEDISQAVPNIPNEQTNALVDALPNTSTPSEDILMDEIEDQGEVGCRDYESDDQTDSEVNQDFELTLDDSQNESSEAVEDTQTESLQLNRHDINNTNDKIKCIPTSLLLSSVHGNDHSHAVENSTINTVVTEIEAMTRSIETNEALVTTYTTVKQEKPWLWDPTDYSYIGPRPSLRQMDISHTNVVTHTIEETDDEDDLFLQIPDGSQQENDINERNSDNDVRNDIPSVSDQTADNTDEEISACDNSFSTVTGTLCQNSLAQNTYNSTGNITSEIGLQPENELVRSNIVENNDKDEDITNEDNSGGINSMIHSDDQTSRLKQFDHNRTTSEQIEDQMNAIGGHINSHDAEIRMFVDEVASNDVSSNGLDKNSDQSSTLSDKHDLPKKDDIEKEIYDESESCIKNKLITQSDQVEIVSDYSEQIQVKTESKEPECQMEDNSELMRVRNEPIDFAIDLRNHAYGNGLIQSNESNDFAIVSYINEIDNNVEWNIRDRAVESIGPGVRDVSSLHTHAYSLNYSRHLINEIDNSETRAIRAIRTAEHPLNVPSYPEVVIQGRSNNVQVMSSRHPFDNEIDNYEWGRRTGHGSNFERNNGAFQNANNLRNNRVDFNVSVVMSDRNVVEPTNTCSIS